VDPSLGLKHLARRALQEDCDHLEEGTPKCGPRDAIWDRGHVSPGPKGETGYNCRFKGWPSKTKARYSSPGTF
jgi:hypothetical protein